MATSEITMREELNILPGVRIARMIVSHGKQYDDPEKKY
jgi:hypothetical protein